MNVSNKAFYERTHSLITGVTSLIVGRQPPPVPVALLPRIMYLVAVLFPLVELVLLVRQLRAWQRDKTPSTTPGVARGALFKAGLPLLSGLFGAALILFGLLWWTHVPLRVALLNQPDMAWALILLAGLIVLRTGLKTLRSALGLWRARTARLVQA
jgi:hypothetical protein